MKFSHKLLFLLAILSTSTGNSFGQQNQLYNYLKDKPQYSIFFRATTPETWQKLNIAEKNGEKVSVFVITDQKFEFDSLLMLRTNNGYERFVSFDRSYMPSKIIYWSSNDLEFKNFIVNQYCYGEQTGNSDKEFLRTLGNRYARILNNNSNFELIGSSNSRIGYNGIRDTVVRPKLVHQSEAFDVYEVNALMSFDVSTSLHTLLRITGRTSGQIESRFFQLGLKAGLWTVYGLLDPRLEGNENLFLTAFVPNDEALLNYEISENIKLDELPQNELRKLLLNHFIYGENIFSDGKVESGIYPVLNDSGLQNTNYYLFQSIHIVTDTNKIGYLSYSGDTLWFKKEIWEERSLACYRKFDHNPYNASTYYENFVVHEIDRVISNKELASQLFKVYKKLIPEDSASVTNIYNALRVYIEPQYKNDIEKWPGIKILNGRVVEIILPNRFLTGYIHSDIGKLTELKVFDVSKNPITGTLPMELENNTELEVFNIDECPITISNYINVRENSGFVPFSYTGLGKGYFTRFVLSEDSITVMVNDEHGSGEYNWSLNIQSSNGNSTPKNYITYIPQLTLGRNEFIKALINVNINYPDYSLNVRSGSEIITPDIDTIRTTVHWAGVKTLNNFVVIADSGHLIVDPGTTVNFMDDRRIELIETAKFTLQGTAEDSIFLTGISNADGTILKSSHLAQITMGYVVLNNNLKVINQNGSLDVTNSRIIKSEILSSSIITLKNVKIKNSKGFNTSGVLTAENCLFQNNNSINTLIKHSNGTASFEDCKFLNNNFSSNKINEDDHYHILNIYNSNAIINNCEFKDNWFETDCHLINFDGFYRNLTITNNTIENNFVANSNTTWGTIINVNNARNVDISNNYISKNGRLKTTSLLDIKDVLIFIESNNTFRFSENKLHLGLNSMGLLNAVSENTVQIINNEFIGLYRAFSQNQNVHLIGNVFAANHINFRSGGIIANNTVLKEEFKTDRASMIYPGNITNNIMPDFKNFLDVTFFDLTEFNYNNNVMPKADGVGQSNINIDPLFAKPFNYSYSDFNLDKTVINLEELNEFAQIINESDFSLQPNSLCIDGGLEVDDMPNTDVYGNSRIQHGRIDIGAVEHSYKNKSDYANQPEPIPDTTLSHRFTIVHLNQPRKLLVDMGPDSYDYLDSVSKHGVAGQPIYINGGTGFISYYDSSFVRSNNTGNIGVKIYFIQDEAGCTATDSIHYQLVGVGLEGTITQSGIIDLIPSPLYSHIRIISDKPMLQTTTIQVYDLNGRQMETVKIPPFNNSIDIKLKVLQKHSGIYVIRFNNPIQTISKKIILK